MSMEHRFCGDAEERIVHDPKVYDAVDHRGRWMVVLVSSAAQAAPI